IKPVTAPYQESAENVVRAFESDARRGLTNDEARARVGRYGLNQLAADRPIPAWRKFFRQFRDVLVVLLLIATATSFALWLYERDAALPSDAIEISAVGFLHPALG